MEKEILLTDTHRAPTDVAVISDQNGGYTFAWSADGATYVTRLFDRDRIPSKPIMILRPGGGRQRENIAFEKTFRPSSDRPSIASEDLDLISLSDEKKILVMLELPDESRTGGAFASLFSSDGILKKTVLLGPVGEYATEIAALLWDEKILIAWHDGTLHASKIHLARLNAKSLEMEEKADFQGRGAVANPTLSMGNSLPVIAWSEIESREKEDVSRVNTARISKDLTLNEQKTVAMGRFIFPSPGLISKNGSLGLIFRDDADKDDTPEFYFLLLNGNGAPAAEKKRISQADGLKGPSLSIQGNFYISAAIRSFQRNLLIGLNRFDNQGIKQNGEFQVYADKTDFVRVDIACAKDSLMMIYGEDKRTSGRVLAGRIICGDKQ